MTDTDDIFGRDDATARPSRSAGLVESGASRRHGPARLGEPVIRRADGSTTSTPAARLDATRLALSRKSRAITPPATGSIGKQASRRAAIVN